MGLKIGKLRLDSIRNTLTRRDVSPIKNRRKLIISPLFAIALLLAVLLPFAAAFLLCAEIEIALAGRIMQAQDIMSAMVPNRTQSAFSTSIAQVKRELSFRPFGVIEKTPASQSDAHKNAAPIDAFQLIGTVRPVAAWLEVDSKGSMVLKGQEYNGYTLTEVNSDNVVFSLDDEHYTLYLKYSSGSSRPQKKRTESRPQQQPASSNIQNAEFNGQDGTVSRELLHSLLMNPYDELGKLRLVPTNSGMIVESMRADSLLNELGVKPGDEITGINGISIKDVPSIMNAINSMMSGARLDFDVTRANQAGTLGYVVK